MCKHIWVDYCYDCKKECVEHCGEDGYSENHHLKRCLKCGATKIKNANDN